MVQHRRRGEGQGGGQEAGGARGEGSDTARGRVAGRTSSGVGCSNLEERAGEGGARGAFSGLCRALCGAVRVREG